MARRSGSWPGRTGGSCRCTATGCSAPSPTPRTPSGRRCWPPGGAWAGSPGDAGAVSEWSADLWPSDLVHCYRMLGSFADAEDAVQETMLAAWRGIGGFTEERASLRTWLYKIATNRCLNARRAASRRPARERDVSQYEPLVPTPRDEAVWLQPFPDALLEGAVDGPPGPEARYEQTEAISLAFVTA